MFGEKPFLVVDCETAGLPRSRRASYHDLGNWPRPVQIAWALYDKRGRRTRSESHIIRPEGYDIPASAAAIHGITTERALAEGHAIRDVLPRLYWAAQEVRVIVAHNAEFDGNVLAAEFLRQGWRPAFEPELMTCTMKAGTDLCAIPGPFGNKWPTLEELHQHLFDTPVADAHDAAADVDACARCFVEMRRRGWF